MKTNMKPWIEENIIASTQTYCDSKMSYGHAIKINYATGFKDGAESAVNEMISRIQNLINASRDVGGNLSAGHDSLSDYQKELFNKLTEALVQLDEV